jgi:hypothetical protein
MVRLTAKYDKTIASPPIASAPALAEVIEGLNAVEAFQSANVFP